MNYRHAFHAGNHADIFKHVALSRVLARMLAKDKPVHFIDGHAGIGWYDLMGEAAGKTLEWQSGIGKLAEPFANGVEPLLTPFRQAVSALNGGAGVLRYPGSPYLATALLRPQDKVWLNELHPDDCALLARNFSHDKRARVLQLDAGAALKQLLPISPGRALVLLDPPYEQPDEVQRVVKAVRTALQRMRMAVVMIWYPIKTKEDRTGPCKAILALDPPDLLRAELLVREMSDQGGLAGSGLLIVNAPWKTDEDLIVLAPALADRLGVGRWGKSVVSWEKRSR